MGLPQSIFITTDGGLQRHWVQSLGRPRACEVPGLSPLAHIKLHAGVIWVDLSTPNLPPWQDDQWVAVFQREDVRVVAASSSPNDEEGIAALDAGCVAYCHAFSDSTTLRRVQQAVRAGNVWIGKTLMSRLLKNTVALHKPLASKLQDWQAGLTAREVEVAKLAAFGASNLTIAAKCDITERTVKAHLSAVFEKLNIKDRLQLALKVHGIQ